MEQNEILEETRRTNELLRGQLLWTRVAAALLAGIGVASEYAAHIIPEWVMLALFLLAFFFYGYCIKRAWKVARFIKRVKRRIKRGSNKPTAN